ncbi:hypothetical protein DPMN_159399 [Dreissena polymorpha]|uniref:Uncharacterized protein n=1 Tax=Dreissena polymorpha TaxID=45954 RepID=A0A9D4EKZ3_DREPO|nr:hypothetical protein DPMN_159399 [Dreissena polymorpha]
MLFENKILKTKKKKKKKKEISSRHRRSATYRSSRSEREYRYIDDDNDDYDEGGANERLGFHGGHWDQREPPHRQTPRTALTSYQPASHGRVREDSRVNDDENWLVARFQMM